MNIEEIEVQAPWGHIAVKAWGDARNPIVLCFHGLMDNAGSFDRIIPLLPDMFYYACIDLPGHGMSSHYPPHLPIYTINNLLVYKIMVEHFKRERYILMGHSWGGQVAILFAQLYPQTVEKLVILDAINMPPIPVKIYQQYVTEKLEFVLNLYERQKSGSPPSYTFDEAVQKCINSRFTGRLKKEAAVPMVRRNLKPAAEEGKFYLTLDQRLKSFFGPTQDVNYSLGVLKKYPVVCPTLVVFGSESEWQRMMLQDFLKHYKTQKNFIIKYAAGDHDVHNNSPELVAPHVTKFLLKTSAKL